MCGIVGLIKRVPSSDSDAKRPAELTIRALTHLQHRGEETSGIACLNNGGVTTLKHSGPAADLDHRRVDNLISQRAVAWLGHNRYATSGAKGDGHRNIQPLAANSKQYGEIGFVHNGNVPNLATDDGCSDSVQILRLLVSSSEPSFDQALISTCAKLKAAYCLLVINGQSLYVCRDSTGIRPVVLGQTDELTIVASETCALKAIGATLVRHILPGEILKITADRIASLLPAVGAKSCGCLMEYAYFARPDSVVDNIDIARFRYLSGQILAQEAPPPPDSIIVPVIDSGAYAAAGYAAASGIALVPALMRSRGVGRTFIMPKHELITDAIKVKHIPIEGLVSGQSLVLVDDSIVRGNTTRVLVQMLKEVGAREIHVRIATPPIRYGCHWGMDFANQQTLIAHGKTVDEVRQSLGVNSLAYLSQEAIRQALGHDGADNSGCYSCITGETPS